MRYIASYKGFKIYQAVKSNENNGYLYAAYSKDTSPRLDSPEWQADNTKEISNFIDSYDTEVEANGKKRSENYAF